MIDWTRVDELRDEVGAEDFAEVADMFLEEVDEAIGRLKTDTAPAALEADLHFIKGSALNLGFSELGAICAAGEKQAADGLGDHVDLDGIVMFYAASVQEFTQRLGIDRAA